MTATPASSTCHVCGRSFPRADLRAFGTIRPALSRVIAQAAPGWGPGGLICLTDLREMRLREVAALLAGSDQGMSALDRQVAESLARGEPVSQDPDEIDPEAKSFGARAADRVAAFGGSWTFILIFCAILLLWMGLNLRAVLFEPFDPYPFILLNLVLSSLAALQAPVIMMSQRRQEMQDRRRAENDYRVNLKAELEIRQLHEKVDQLMAVHLDRLVQLQQIEIEMLEDAARDRAHD